MESICYFNGKILPNSKVKLHISDLGLLRGYGIFEFFRTQNSKPFLMEGNLDRFEKSAALVGLELPVNRKEIEKIIFKLLKVNNFKESGIKLILTGGYSLDAITPVKPNFIILTNEYKFAHYKAQQKGLKLITYEYQRDFPEIKSLNYFVPVLLRDKCIKVGAFDFLYHNKGEVRELSRSNFFLVKNKTIITPNTKILMGVTRKKIIDLVALEFNVEERTVKLNEINEADEAFISSSGRKILPIKKIDDKILSNGKVGKCTKKIIQMFSTFENAY